MNIKELTVTVPNDHISQQLESKPAKDFDIFVDSFAPLFKQQLDFMSAMDYENHESGLVVLELELTNSSQLDMLYVASGFGLGQHYFSLFGIDSQGVDTVSHYIHAARASGINCQVGDALALPFKEGSFKQVISRDFLRPDYLNVSDIETALVEQHRVLEQGGIAINYSATLDGPSTTFASDQRLPIEQLSLPFSELRRYKIDFEGAKKYVDVFEK